MRHLSFFIEQLVSQSCTLRDRVWCVLSVMPDPLPVIPDLLGNLASVMPDGFRVMPDLDRASFAASLVMPDPDRASSADYQSIKSINL